MVTNAVEFEVEVDTDWNISIPVEYREYLPPKSRVIILPKSNDDMRDLIRVSEGTTDFWDNEDDKVWDNV